MKWLTSFRIQLFGILITLIILLIASVVLSLRSASAAANSLSIVNVIGQQRVNALLLDSTLDLMEGAQGEAEHDNLVQLISSLIVNFDQAQTDLREGNVTLGIHGLQDPNVLSLLGELDDRWLDFRSTVTTAINLSAEQIAALDSTINLQSNATYLLADRLAKAVDTLADFEIAATQQLIISIIVLSLVVGTGALIIINSIVRSMSRLALSAEQLGAGNLKTRTSPGRINEIARVGAVFNEMAVQIEERIVEAQTARERAERSDNVKSAFLASMSHELRTPLNAIINFTKFVAKGDLGPVNEEQRGTLFDVVDSAKHLLNLINDVLDMSKIESGSLKLFITDDVDVKSILLQVESTARILIQDKPVTVQMKVAEDLPRIRADRQRIVQIMLNIVSNACKFTEEGIITIRAEQFGQSLQIAVSDTGPGIPLEDHAAVFEPFKQTDSGLRQGGGTGLGMPITKNLVEAHGGQLLLDSQNGKGATFTIVLPITSDILVPTFA